MNTATDLAPVMQESATNSIPKTTASVRVYDQEVDEALANIVINNSGQKSVYTSQYLYGPVSK